MDNHFVRISDKESFEQLISESAKGPVVLFKHSTTCPISGAAYEEMSALNVPVNIVVVQNERDVSDEIEARTAVEHHSPQVIVLRNGKAVWNASHWKVKADAVEKAVQQVEGQ
jgi:bacillithiol system protein YtxJ